MKVKKSQLLIIMLLAVGIVILPKWNYFYYLRPEITSTLIASLLIFIFLWAMILVSVKSIFEMIRAKKVYSSGIVLSLLTFLLAAILYLLPIFFATDMFYGHCYSRTNLFTGKCEVINSFDGEESYPWYTKPGCDSDQLLVAQSDCGGVGVIVPIEKPE